MMNRKQFLSPLGRSLSISLCLLVFAVGAASAGGRTEAAATRPSEAGNQAPQLAAMVEAGLLPPLEERLPSDPMVLVPHERIGTYGGDMRSAFVGSGDSAWLQRTILYDSLVRISPDWSDEFVPNFAKSVDVNENATEFTFHLRDGVRWSDGEPWTVEDMRFWYEDVATGHTDVFGSQGRASLITDPGGNVGQMIIEDDLTVKFVFQEPFALFLARLAAPQGSVPIRWPRHYMEQFHIKYNPDVETIAKDAGFATWADYFFYNAPHDYTHFARNVDLPVIHAFVVVEPYTGDSTRVVFERNPYYWKTDTAGNQLPYVDNWIFAVLESTEVLLLQTLAGNIDLMHRHINTAANRPTLFDQQERGGYRLYDAISADMNFTRIMFYQNHSDPVKQEIFQNKDFRIGLSYAINRRQMSELLHAGMTEPWQLAPQRQTPFFHERLATQYTEYNVDLANEHLDRAGYTRRDSAGFRLGPDGRRIMINFDAVDAFPQRIDAAELIVGYWRAVGVDVNLSVVSRELQSTRQRNQELDILYWGGDGGINAIYTPENYMVAPGNRGFWALNWSQWLYGTEEDWVTPIEPPTPVQRQTELYTKLLSSPPSQHAALMYEILDIAADMFYGIGTLSMPPAYGIVSNRVQNWYYGNIVEAWNPYPTPAPIAIEQLFVLD